MPNDRPVLAIYDFRSKQEYIYRTNRMQEITGASELIAGMYQDFIAAEVPSDDATGFTGGHLWKDWDGKDRDGKDVEPRELFKSSGSINLENGEIGIVVYEGGGNLLVLFRDRNAYVRANRVFSRHVIKKAYSLSMISACVDWSANEDFESVRKRLFVKFDRAKRIGVVGTPTNVLPFTLVDRATFQPIEKREFIKKEELELSREARCKREKYKGVAKAKSGQKGPDEVSWEEQGKYIDNLGTEKFEDSLIAVLYFDGNSIGDAVTHLLDEVKGTPGQVAKMRAFSQEIHQALVERTEKEIKAAVGRSAQDVQDDDVRKPDGSAPGALQRKQRGYRVIVDHGDEITLVCNAHAAPLAIDAYFKAIEDSEYKACCGVAFCHAHDPFAEVYKIAEECCESGKEANRRAIAEAMKGVCDSGGDEGAMRQAGQDANASYVDFHFVRSGITGTLGQIRDAQEKGLTARPYQVGEGYGTFTKAGVLLAHSKLQRSDLKALNRAILRGDSWYQLEYARLAAKDPAAMGKVEEAVPDMGLRKRILFDVTSMWDVFDVRYQRFEEEGGAQ